MTTHNWLKKYLQIPYNENVGEITIPFDKLVELLHTFHKYELTKDICPKCGSFMVKENDNYICTEC